MRSVVVIVRNNYRIDGSENQYLVEADGERFAGTVTSTGSWDKYALRNVGEISLSVGRQKVFFRPTPQFCRALLDLRRIRLEPVR